MIGSKRNSASLNLCFMAFFKITTPVKQDRELGATLILHETQILGGCI